MHIRAARQFVFALLSWFLLVFLSAQPSQAQISPSPGLNRLIAQIDSFGNRYQPEKLYVQLDKPYYTTGDTIWFKAYLLQADLLPSKFSGVLYAELTNDSNQVAIRFRLPAVSGLSWGSMALTDVPAGSYTFRVYSNRQRNFAENMMFSRKLYISSQADNTWLVNAMADVQNSVKGQHMNIDLALSQADRNPAGLQDLLLRIRQGKKTWYREQQSTNIRGKLNVGFDVPAGTPKGNWVIEATERNPHVKNPRKLVIPLRLNNPDIDLQFMPEGGHMVTGLPTHVGFKAINSNGYGTDVSGVVKNSKNETVATLVSIYKGMGIVDFTPEEGETYKAEITKADGTTQKFLLPAAHPSGLVLRLRPYSQLTDTLQIVIAGTPDLAASAQAGYYLVAHAQGVVCWAGQLTFSGKQVVLAKVATKGFPPGVISLTLFSATNQPVAERSVFIRPASYLHMEVSADKKIYHNRDSISFSLQVTDEAKHPVQGSFSIAVTDDGQVKADTLNYDNIISRLLLSANLKGNIENPDYYLNEHGIKNLAALDDLLLTQGWTSYNWADVFAPAKPLQYAAEPNFSVTGRVAGIFNNGKADARITLFSQKPLIMRDTVAYKNGRFVFDQLPIVDSTVAFIIQGRNKKGGKTNLGVEMDEFIPPVFVIDNRITPPWYVNADSALLVQNHYVRQKKVEEEKQTGNMLKAVTIKGMKIIKNSHNLNGPGQSDWAMDEAELLKTPKKSLIDLLKEKIPGFGEYVPRKSTELEYMYHSMRVKFIFDGVRTDFYYEPNPMIPNDYYNFIKGILNQYTAADIKGIEMMSNPSHSMSYDIEYKPPMDVFPPGPGTHTYIEITTRDGRGPFINQSPYVVAYRPLPFSLPKQFYSPKYTVKNAGSKQPDLRSTIYWNPNVITNAEGKATLSFYSADLPGSYTITIDGTDLQGRLGFQQGKIKVVTDLSRKLSSVGN